MINKEPIDEKNIAGYGAPIIAWERVREHFEADKGISPTHWLATVRPDGRPHVMPLWVVWLDNVFYFVANPTTRKSKNLAHNPHCVITVASAGIDLVVEGEATKVRDEALLQRVARAYILQGWHPTVRDGAFYADFGAPSAGPPPYEVYQVFPVTVFGLARDEPFGATRWRFLPLPGETQTE